jgi:hypothetical protein
MSIQVHSGNQMDVSGTSLLRSSPIQVLFEVADPPAPGGLPRDDRIPLPPGHPLSWRLITLGTLLEGSAFGDSL